MNLNKLLVCLLLFSNTAFSYDQFAEAEKRAALAREVCGNGHSATIVMGKVTECDGRTVGSHITKKEPEKIVWPFECFAVGKYILCEDGFYQQVSPIVAKALLSK